MKKILLGLCLMLSTILSGQNLDSTYIKATVMAVKDGDSYAVKIGEDRIWVRMAFIDAPETFTPPYVCNAQSFGVEIGDIVRNEIKGKEVYIKFLGTDIYNRPLVRVNVNGVDFNTELVKRGFAWVLDDKKLLSRDEYKILITYKKMAVKQKLGLFYDKKPITPSLFRKRNKCK